jgi:hypothetical protein
VDKDYINQLFPMQPYPKYEKPDYFHRPGSLGAHRSVIYVEERVQDPIEKLGQTYSFQIKDLTFVVDTKWTRKIKKGSFFRSKYFIRRPTLKGFVLLTNRFYRRKSSIFLRFASKCLGLYLQAFET